MADGKSKKSDYNHTEREAHWSNFWRENKVYDFDLASSSPIFSVDTPPPYVSAAHLHAGHIMSYTQAEFVVRYKRMRGFNVFYPMGFDDNGLPTERYVEKKYKIDKSKISKQEFIDLCLKETKIGGETYRRFFDSLGISVDWSLLYSTIDEHCQRIAQRSFIDLFQKKVIVRKKEPVIWCTHCQTALAQSDLDDVEKEGKLNYINFKFYDGKIATIATTRPELLSSCVALFVNSGDERYKNYIGKTATVPLFNYQVPVLADNQVDINYGTGLMMVCTWGDSEDIERWKNNSLNTRISITKDGKLDNNCGKYSGLSLEEAREKIIEDLKKENILVKQEKINHTINVHERCSTPIDFVLAPQWFIRIVDNKDDWKKRGEEIDWFPKFMKSRFMAWIDGLKWDWCISRQRYYGVPFPLWYCKKCGEIVLPEDKDLPINPIDSEPKKSCLCGSNEFIPEKDVMDTWMTSSLTPLINAYWKYPDRIEFFNKIYPMDLRVQAFEIIRTWLFYTVVKSHYHTDSIPWKKVMISGWGLDSVGKKISKSLGNYEEPEILLEKFSADALRFWSAGATLGQNLRYNEEEIKVGQKTVRKLLNAAKFSQIHLENFQSNNEINFDMLEKSDLWILCELKIAIENYCKYFDKYEYSLAKEIANRFFWDKFCDNYLEFIKYRLYSDNNESKEKALSTLYSVLLSIIKMFAPITPFVTEEIFQNLFTKKENSISIHKTQIDAGFLKDINNNILAEFSEILEIVSFIRGYKTSKGMSIKKELSKVKIQSKNPKIKDYENFLKNVLAISVIEFSSEGAEKTKISITE